MTTALLLIDTQNDYFPGGRMELFGADQAGANARRALEHFRTLSQPVIHVRHVALDEGATFFLPNTTGVEIHPLVTPLEGEDVITKHTPNAFVDTALANRLRSLGIDTLVIVGMMTHMCVDSTTRAASDEGFNCTVLGDACATTEQTYGDVTVPAPLVHAAFLSALSGTFATVRTTSEYLE